MTPFSARWPVDRPARWKELVNDALPTEELAVLRATVNRGRPFGSASWMEQAAGGLGLTSTLNRVGRPTKR